MRATFSTVNPIATWWDENPKKHNLLYDLMSQNQLEIVGGSWVAPNLG